MTSPLPKRGPAQPRRATPPIHRSAELPTGVADMRLLPDEEFLALWDSILVDAALKEQLLAQGVFNFTVRPVVPRVTLPLHGIILLTGEPGTGKTSLAKGLAARTAEALHREGADEFRYVEVDPHALASGALGKTQRAVTGLFGSTITEQAALGPTIVLLDEVETIVADRVKLSLDANPIDVHRATDAALVQLDHLAEAHPNVLFVATSNFPQAIDAAFVSRADLVLRVPLPDEDGRLRILRSTLEGMAPFFRGLGRLAASPELATVARDCAGLDGRAVRKLVAAACTRHKQTALHPEGLTISGLRAAANHAVREALPRAGR